MDLGAGRSTLFGRPLDPGSLQGGHPSHCRLAVSFVAKMSANHFFFQAFLKQQTVNLFVDRKSLLLCKPHSANLDNKSFFLIRVTVKIQPAITASRSTPGLFIFSNLNLLRLL